MESNDFKQSEENDKGILTRISRKLCAEEELDKSS